jgi:hypothetical protein
VNAKKGKPRTGDGYTAKGRKPSETGLLRMQTPEWGGRATSSQPKGWGIARVVSIFKNR